MNLLLKMLAGSVVSSLLIVDAIDDSRSTLVQNDAYQLCLNAEAENGETLCLDGLVFEEEGNVVELWEINLVREVNEETYEVTLSTGLVPINNCLSSALPNGTLGFSSCEVSTDTVFALIVEGSLDADSYTIRDTSEELCLSALAEDVTDVDVILAEDLTTGTTVLLQACYDSLTCANSGNEIACSSREISQLFSIEGLADELSVPVMPPSPTPRFQIPPSPLRFQPFSDTFERIYQPLFLAVFVGIITLTIWKFNLVPEKIKDTVRCPTRRNQGVLDGLDIPGREQPSASI